jgi:energy-coupling factor transporter ATP-binding protein EcfA2
MRTPQLNGKFIVMDPDAMGIGGTYAKGDLIIVVNSISVAVKRSAGVISIPPSFLKNGYITKLEEEDMSDKSRDELVAALKAKMGAAAKTTVEPTPEPVVVAVAIEPVVLAAPSEQHELFSKLFGYTPAKGGDFYVRAYQESDWVEEDHQFIPSMSKFCNFVIPEDVLAQEVRALELGLKVLVVGPSGSGKTTLQEFICAVLKQPYLRINGRQDMESDTLLGKPWVSGGTMEFMLGELPKALIKGWFIAFDEPWKTPAGIQMSLQRMYERGGILQLDDMVGTLADKQIIPLESSKFVLCDNVVGTGDGADKYGATMIQDGSTLNRIDVVLRLDYLSGEQEGEMLCKMHPTLDNTTAGSMVRVGHLIRVGYEQGELSAAFSPRNLDAWAMLSIAMGGCTREAFEATILGRYAEDAERGAVQEHYRNVFG